MGSIRLLPEHIRNVIAAGEVIERPASVVKELIENSIDAGAEEIKIEILYGGKKLIRVSDNGFGMDREDALLSIQRFATSKIYELEDLSRLVTFGFRGEALASIAQVSKLTIETGTTSSEPATFIEVMGGDIKRVQDAPPLKGTIITVRDLFFNTPARRKFLRANSTELNHIVETVISEALASIKRSYRLFAEQTELLFFPQAYEPRERITQVFGIETIEHMIEFEAEANSSEKLRIHGFISRPPEIRSRKTGQYIFINGRPVKDSIISRAVYDGLSEELLKDKHPLFVIYLTIPSEMVDFNVHPAKREVRFSNGSLIYEFVRDSVAREFQKEKRIITHPNYNLSDQISGDIPSSETKNFQTTTVSYSPKDFSYSLHQENPISLFEPPYVYKEEEDLFIPFGDLFAVKPIKEGLLIMDMHAAHERILYEKFLKGDIKIKRLLFPKNVPLRPDYKALLLKYQSLLMELGFEIEDFGSALLVRAIPEFARIEDSLIPIFEDIATYFADLEDKKPTVMSPEGVSSSSEFFENKKTLSARLACHKSIRAKDPVTSKELEALYLDLINTSDPYHCPHGRPTMIKITIEELFKRFGRA